jgi:tetratricopeptide (TPR) repeat protein
MDSLEKEWVYGRITLGAAAKWSAEEIRIVSELAFALAQQGRNSEAISIFEGLNVLAPSTVYFNIALGALWLREKNYSRALKNLNIALRADRNDIPSRLNRAEALFHLGRSKESRQDLEFVLNTKDNSLEKPHFFQCRTRARALLLAIQRLPN